MSQQYKFRLTSMNRKKRRIVVWSIVAFVTTLLLLYPIILKVSFKHQLSQLENNYNIEIKIDKTKFKGYNQLLLRDCIVLSNHDTIIRCNETVFTVDLFSDKKISPHITSFIADQVTIFYRENTLEANRTSKQSNKNGHSHHRLRSFFVKLTASLPEEVNINSIVLQFLDDTLNSECRVTELKISNKDISGLLTIEEQSEKNTWLIIGESNTEHSHLYCQLTLQEVMSKRKYISFIDRLFGVKFLFEKIAVSLNVLESKNENLQLSISGNIDNCQFNYPYFSKEEVQIDSISFLVYTDLSDEKLFLDRRSTVTVNGFPFHPEFLLEKRDKHRIAISIDETDINVNRFLQSVPKGLFQLLPKMKIEGKVDFSFLFDCDFSDIENLKLDFNLSSPGLIIPPEDLQLITYVNHDFEYTCFENGDAVQQIEVSADNPRFVSYENIPFYLKYAILVSEDPSFFRHKGIIKSSFREAVIVDIKRGEYARGGSTITMQFVKNLFLKKEKLISRKLEEIILTWMIEDLELISKEKMFEIYVNIIEWAPMVWGIHEAASFYFDKSPDLLTFGECVYLATLIRSPKQYAHTIDEEGKVTPGRRAEMHLIARKMLDRNMITPAQYENFNSFVITRLGELKEEY